MKIGIPAQLLCAIFGLTQPMLASGESVDLLLKGGLILDGSDQPGKEQDIAIHRGKIHAIGDLKEIVADQTIDCRGLVITPGFIDLHNHSDDTILAPSTRANVCYLMQGCTSIVTGNCGFGPIEVGKYLAQVDQHHAGTNVLHLIPHGDLRTAVLGKEARAPHPEELVKMKEIVEQGMKDGAWGMSTGLIYVPGTYAKTEEIQELAKVVGQHHGIYASHIRNEGSQLLDSVEEAIRIGRYASLPVHVSHFKASGSENWGTLHVAAKMIEEAQRNGTKVTADQYPYIASSTSLDATLLPSWSREGGRSKLEERLKDPTTRGRIRSEVAQGLGKKSRIQIASFPKRRDWVGKSIEEIAKEEGEEIVDIVLKMESEGGAKVVNFGMSEEEVRLGMTYPWVATASDGGAKIPNSEQPHPRSFGTFSRKLGFYSIREKVLSMPMAIRSATGLPADILGLQDRGYLRPGYAADIAVFHPERVIDRATYTDPYRFSEGMVYVFVNGIPAIFHSIPTGALAGKAVRKNLPMAFGKR